MLIFAEGESQQICYNNRNEDKNNVSIWLKMNKFKLNESKTKLMEVNSDNNITFKINNQILEKLNQMKYLGFIIDKNIKFKKHCLHM